MVEGRIVKDKISARMKRGRAALLLGCSIFLFSNSLFSLPGRFFRFERLPPEYRGAPVPGISSMLQDKEGYLWFGTNLGLARYDGYRFDFFSPKSGPDTVSPSVIVYPVFLDTAGDIWIGTAGRGLFRFDRATETFSPYPYISTTTPDPGGDIVLAIQEDMNRDLWVGTRLDGLFHFDRKTKAFERIPLDPKAGAIWDLLVDRDGILWIGTQEGGLFRRNPATGEINNFRFILDNPRSLGSNTVWTIFQDRQGAIWVGTRGGGLNKYVPDREEFVRFTGDATHPQDLVSPSITALAEDEAGRLWIGTSWNGLRIWDRTTGEYTILKYDSQDRDTIGDDNVTSVLKDASGIMWVGTTRGGINKCLADRAKFLHYKHNRQNPLSISRNDVRSLWRSDPGRLWVGFDEGLDEIDELTGRVTRFRNNPGGAESLGPGAVLAVLEDGEGRVWVGLDGGGLDCLDCRSGHITHYRSNPADPTSLSNDKVYAISPDRTSPGVLWIGTHQGLNRLDTRTHRFTRFLSDASNPASLSGNIITAVLEDRSGSLWVGTRWGLNRMDKSTRRFERHIGDIKNPSGKGPNDNIINCIHEDGAGILWLGTDSGLNRFDWTSGEWRYYVSRDGLPGEVVCGILEDQSGFLWVSTNRGLARFDPRSGSFRGFSLHDGIQANQFNARACFRSADERMYFGGVNGFNEFRPEGVKADAFVPPIVWTGIYQNDQRITAGGPLSRLGSLDLPYRVRFISFEFAALSFLSPSSNTFAYKLEARDKDWVGLGHDHAVSFSNLPKGRYVLRVNGANPDGVWNEQGLSIKLTVIPPFWRTTWFAVLALLFVTSGVATVVLMWIRLRSAFTVVADRADSIIESYELTIREKEILRLVLQGASNKDIAAKLFISGSTVRNHISNIYQKVGVNSRLDLINRISRDAQKKA
jgi:ligand-binding sensor domain-containing protein/DNA-binding CsgD family transcriptional regulator